METHMCGFLTIRSRHPSGDFVKRPGSTVHTRHLLGYRLLASTNSTNVERQILPRSVPVQVGSGSAKDSTEQSPRIWIVWGLAHSQTL